MRNNSLLLRTIDLGIGLCPRHSLLAQTKILKKISNEAIVPDSSPDFSSDFERSDPPKTTPSSEVIERILVRILVKDFYQDNPKLKSSQKCATVRCF